MSFQYPTHIKLVEVGPRDGLQNESTSLSLADKSTFINLLSRAGFSHIEVGSFVSANKVPQMAETDILFKQIERDTRICYSALVPNQHGMKSALAANADEIAIFTAASETFNQKNINCSIKESLARFKPVIACALENQLKVRAYISCALGCPYEGKVDASIVQTLTKTLIEMGCYEISLGDTIGIATPHNIEALLSTLLRSVQVKCLAVHFHNTYGQALANILMAMQMGITVIDSSIAGLGGCPFAKGASGNVASEDVIYMLEGMNIKTGVNLSKAIEAGNFISQKLNKPNRSMVSTATS